MCTDADENSDSSLILKKKHTHTVDPVWPWLSFLNALLFSKMSVLLPARTWSRLLLSLPLLQAPCQSSDLCLLLFPLLFLLLPHCPFWGFQLHVLSLLCHLTTFPLLSWPRCLPLGLPSALTILPIPQPLEGIAPYLGGREEGEGKFRKHWVMR